MLLCLPNMIMWLLSFLVLIWFITLSIYIAEHLDTNDLNLWRIMMVDNFYAVGVSVLMRVFACLFIRNIEQICLFLLYSLVWI